MEIIVYAGPNGAGKSTIVRRTLPRGFTFLNADDIALQISSEPSARRDVMAGRMFLERLDTLAREGADIAVETTLAGRSLATRIVRMQSRGFAFRLVFVWLESPELAIERVAERVRHGGHDVPEDVVRRRYHAGIRNFWDVYRPQSDHWRLMDNSASSDPRLVAEGYSDRPSTIFDRIRWRHIRQVSGYEND